MNKTSKIYIAGHTGLVGSALLRKLKSKGYENFVFTTFPEYDLTNQQTVADFFTKEKPEYVFLAAAKVGGIVANNTYRGQFIYENLMMQSNIIHQSYLNGVKKLLFLGSSCIYPANCPQPMKEDYLLTEVLEYTNEPYAISKIAGIKTIESYNLQYGTNYISVMPTNLYGQNDNFDLEKSHVLPALIRKMHLGKSLMNNDFEALRNDLNKRPVEEVSGKNNDNEIISILKKYGIEKERIQLWGTGTPRREFLNSDDLADACVYLMETYNFKEILQKEFQIENPQFPITIQNIKNTHINIGVGTDQSIKELAELIQHNVVNYAGKIVWDITKPDGTIQKLLNVDKLHALGWTEKIELKEGIKKVYEDYCKFD